MSSLKDDDLGTIKSLQPKGGIPYKMDWGARQNFEKNSYRYQDPVLWV